MTNRFYTQINSCRFMDVFVDDPEIIFLEFRISTIFTYDYVLNKRKKNVAKREIL